ncbi:MAG: restriction system protein, partial [Chloroflexota bacterium]|nr:restriction system protein [Chloroflexota bacterium]
AAADAAPRLTLLAVLCLGASALALLQLSSTTPWSVVLAPVIRPVAWVGVIGGLVLVAAAARAWARALRDRTGYAGTALTRNELRSLSPERFDDWCAARLRERGYRVTTVAEQGVDLIAERESERLVVQCKRWFGTRPVGEPQLGDLYGAMQHEHANGAVVITTGTFSEPALLWAKGKPIQLWDVDRLMRTAQPNVKSEPRQEVDLAAS